MVNAKLERNKILIFNGSRLRYMHIIVITVVFIITQPTQPRASLEIEASVGPT